MVTAATWALHPVETCQTLWCAASAGASCPPRVSGTLFETKSTAATQMLAKKAYTLPTPREPTASRNVCPITKLNTQCVCH